MHLRSLLAFVIFGFCSSNIVLADAPIAAAPKPEQIKQSVERAVEYLQDETESWLSTRKCAACHHAGMPLWAIGEAARQGYNVDKQFLAETTESLLGNIEKLRATRVFPDPKAAPDPRPQGRGLNMGLPFLAVAARSMPSLSSGHKQSLTLIAEEIIKKQQPDGSWEFFATLRRPPINETQITEAAWTIIALQNEISADAPKSQREALAKALIWFESAKTSDVYQDKIMKLLIAIRTGKSRESVQPAINELLGQQRPDGGWSQTISTPKSDAFATGQTLYVLALAGEKVDRPEIQRGISFLLMTQASDGSWPMTSRATPNGEPGSAKLLTPITCAAASWATLALTKLAPIKK